MEIVCKKGTKKLVKGFKYKVLKLENSDPSTSRVFIKDFGWYTVNNFMTVTGEEIPKKDIDIEPLPSYNNFLDIKDISKNDILICKTDNYKSLFKNSMYRIEELSKEFRKYNGRKIEVDLIKFEGISKKLMHNRWNFEKVPTNIAREIALDQVLNDLPDKVNKRDCRNLRKIDYIDNKESILMSVLAKSILDEKRHGLNLIEWSVIQLGRGINLKTSTIRAIFYIRSYD